MPVSHPVKTSFGVKLFFVTTNHTPNTVRCAIRLLCYTPEDKTATIPFIVLSSHTLFSPHRVVRWPLPAPIKRRVPGFPETLASGIYSLCAGVKGGVTWRPFNFRNLQQQRRGIRAALHHCRRLHLRTLNDGIKARYHTPLPSSLHPKKTLNDRISAALHHCLLVFRARQLRK